MKNFLGLLAVLALAGCETIQPIELAPTDRIGVYIDVDDQLRYQYLGFLVFENKAGEIDAQVERGPQLAALIDQYKTPRLERFDSDLPAIGNHSRLIRQAGELGYTHLLLIQDGSTCLDINCNRSFRGSGIYGAAAAPNRFTSQISYTLIDTRTEGVSYRRRLSYEFFFGELKFKDIPKEPGPAAGAILCLDRANMLHALAELNQVAPLFNIEAGPERPTGGLQSMVEWEECSYMDGATSS